MFPWEKHTIVIKNYPYRSYMRMGGPQKLTCRREKQYLDDTPRLKYRKGDIIKFNCGFIKDLPNGWQEWFLRPKDQKKFWRKDKITPSYAKDQYGVIAGRFRIVKYKWFSTFYDYGCVVMMLTGEKPGYMKTFLMKKPFIKKVLFPKKITYKYLIKVLSDNIINIFNDDYEHTNTGRNLLLSKLYSELNIKGS